MKIDEYKCQNCKEIWQFIPEDYNWDKKLYPSACPHCTMPILSLIKEVYKIDGIMGVFYWLIKRIF